MKSIHVASSSRTAVLLLAGMFAFILSGPMTSAAQDKSADTPAHKHADKTADADKSLADQLRELQAKVAKLEAALHQSHQGASVAGGMSGMAGMGGKSQGMMGGGMMGGPQQKAMAGGGMQGMGSMMDMMMGGMAGQKKGMASPGGPGGGGMAGMEMGGMAAGGMGMMEDDMNMMGMMGKGSMGAKGMKMKMAAALPGFPGASHIYHIGATGFFLDHEDHITLTTQQQTTLNHLKEKALLAKSTSQRKIDEAEQELWTLTASDQPDAAAIEAKIKEIEKLRGDQRIAFIRAVGEAAKVLTEEQRQKLLGLTSPKSDKADPHAGHKHDAAKP